MSSTRSFCAVVSWCRTCGDDRVFEALPCQDRHGADCPERACVDCGAAVLLAGYVEDDRPGERQAA